jgi:hypothetical protein
MEHGTEFIESDSRAGVQIWVASGLPEGEAEQHWLTAEKEILATLALAVPNASAKRRTGRVVGNRAKARTN